MLDRIVAIKNGLNRLLEQVVIWAMGILVLDVVWQVLSRYILNSPSSWSEELAIILLIWVSLLGASVGFVRKSHLGVDFFVRKMAPGTRQRTELVVHLVVAFFAASILLFGGSRIAYLTLLYGQRTPALGIRMGLVYLALPLSGFFILIFSVEQIIEVFNRLKRGETS